MTTQQSIRFLFVSFSFLLLKQSAFADEMLNWDRMGLSDLTALHGYAGKYVGSFSARHNLINDAKGIELPRLGCTSAINLDGNPLEKIDALSGIFVKSINLDHTRILDYTPLQKVHCLENLNLQGNRLTSLAQAIEATPKLTTLKELNVSYNELTELTLLKKHRGLVILRATNNRIRTLLHALPADSRLEEIYLHDNVLTSLAGLEQSRFLKVLDVTGNHLCAPEAFSAIEHFLEPHEESYQCGKEGGKICKVAVTLKIYGRAKQTCGSPK